MYYVLAMSERARRNLFVDYSTLCRHNGDEDDGGFAKVEICSESYYRTYNLSIHQWLRLLRGRFMDPTYCTSANRTPA